MRSCGTRNWSRNCAARITIGLQEGSFGSPEVGIDQTNPSPKRLPRSLAAERSFLPSFRRGLLHAAHHQPPPPPFLLPCLVLLREIVIFFAFRGENKYLNQRGGEIRRKHNSPLRLTATRTDKQQQQTMSCTFKAKKEEEEQGKVGKRTIESPTPRVEMKPSTESEKSRSKVGRETAKNKGITRCTFDADLASLQKQSTCSRNIYETREGRESSFVFLSEKRRGIQ